MCVIPITCISTFVIQVFARVIFCSCWDKLPKRIFTTQLQTAESFKLALETRLSDLLSDNIQLRTKGDFEHYVNE